MKISRIIIAVVITLIAGYLAGRNSRQEPQTVTGSDGGYTFEMTHLPTAAEKDLARIEIKISGEADSTLKYVFRQRRLGQGEDTPLSRYITMPLDIADSAQGHYYAKVSMSDRGSTSQYYIEIRDNSGGRRAALMRNGDEAFTVRAVGPTSTWVLALHVGLLLLAFFFVTLAAVRALDICRGAGGVGEVVRPYMMAAVSMLLGGFVVGLLVNHYTHGTLWSGVPFGAGTADNMVQVLFLYYLFMVLISFGFLKQGDAAGELFSEEVTARFAIFGFVLTFAFFLLPHTRVFDPAQVRYFSYGYVAVLVALYLYGLFLRSARLKKDTGKRRRNRAR